MKTLQEIFPIKTGQKKAERVLLVGKTGSGKTTLEQKLLQFLPNPFIVDAKGEFEFPGANIIDDPAKLSSIRQGDTRPVIYSPKPEYDEFEIYDAVFHWVYQRQNCTLAIDELFAVFAPHQRNRWLRACLTRGRSRNIVTLACTQRPRNIPREILSESDHRIMFALDLLDDKKAMAEVIGPQALKPLPERFSFWYRYSYSDDPVKAYKLDI